MNGEATLPVYLKRDVYKRQVLLVCLSEAFAERVMKSMDLAGIKELEEMCIRDR